MIHIYLDGVLMFKYIYILALITYCNVQAMEHIAFSECQVPCPPHQLDEEDAFQYIRSRMPKPVKIDFIRNFPNTVVSLEVALPTIQDNEGAILVKTLISNYLQLASQGIIQIHIITRDLPGDLAAYKYAYFAHRVHILAQAYNDSIYYVANAQPWSHHVLTNIFNNIRFISICISSEKLEEPVLALALGERNNLIEIDIKDNQAPIQQIIDQLNAKKSK